MMKVRTLLRVSSKQQLHEEDLPIQRAELMSFIAQKKEWVFDKEYMEGAISGYKNSLEKRDVLQQIMEDAKNQEFDVLLAYMSDRIGRKEEYTAYVATLNQLGLQVWTVKDGQLKTQEHIDKLLNYIRFWQNEGESKKTGARVKDALKELVKTGRFVGGRAPFGYELVNSGVISPKGRALKTLQIVEKDAETVRKIFGYAVYQGMGFLRIANALNEEKIPAPIADTWKPSTIASILKNPIYMGYTAYNRREHKEGFVRLDRKEWIYSNHQIKEFTIISPMLWEQAQRIREARKSPTSSVSFRTKGRLLLIGLAYCGYCGKPLKNNSYYNHWETKAGEKKKAFTGRYTCPGEHKERKTYSQNYLEEVVLEVAEHYLEHLEGIELSEEFTKLQTQERMLHEKEIQRIQKVQHQITVDIQTLEENIPKTLRGESCFTPEKLVSLIDEKKEKLDQLFSLERNEVQKLTSVIEKNKKELEYRVQCPDWKEEFRTADISVKSILLTAMIEKIYVKNHKISIEMKTT